MWISRIQFERIQFKTLDHVLNEFQTRNKRSTHNEDALKKFAEIRMIVGVDRSTSLSRCVSALVKESREDQTVRQQLENNEGEATELHRQGRAAHDCEKMSREREIWSRRVYGLFTDSFTTAKSSRELQLSHEETHHASQHQRQLKRRAELS
jgi:hypothetical protein